MTSEEPSAWQGIIRIETGEAFALTPDWPRLPLPAPSERLAAFIDRAIVRHPLVQELSVRDLAVGLACPRVVALRPAYETVPIWEQHHPVDPYSLPANLERGWVDTRAYFLKWVFWRLMAELFDRLRSGDWFMRGRRADDPEQLERIIPRVLFGRGEMILNLTTDSFKPDMRNGGPAPHLTYRDLMLQATEQTPDAPEAASPRSHSREATEANVPTLDTSEPLRTGTQGRPSSIGLIAGELQRRRAAGCILPSLQAEATALADWCGRAHPDAPQPTPKTIRNSTRIKSELRAAVDEARARKGCPK